MHTPHVQDIGMWVNHYTKGIHSTGNTRVSDSDISSAPNVGSMSTNGDMSVSQVEPKGPLPPVPSAGLPALTNKPSPSEVAVRQASYDVMRMKLQAPASARSKRQGKKQSSGGVRKAKASTATKRTAKGVGKKRPNILRGTPQDIFGRIQSSRRGNTGRKKK